MMTQTLLIKNFQWMITRDPIAYLVFVAYLASLDLNGLCTLTFSLPWTIHSWEASILTNVRANLKSAIYDTFSEK